MGFVTACASVLPMFGSALVGLTGVAIPLLEHRTGAAVLLGALEVGVASTIDKIARLFDYWRASGIHPMLTCRCLPGDLESRWPPTGD